MSITAGTLSQVSVASTSDVLAATAATGGSGPYTYQWYRSTTTGFTPGGGNILSGATSLSLSDSGLIPNTVYYYKVVATDTGHSNDTVEYTQLAVTTAAPSLSPNQFAQSPVLGMIDQLVSTGTLSCEIDASQSTTLYAGSAVKVYDSAGGVIKVVGCSADADGALGFITFNMKKSAFVAGDAVEIATDGDVIYLYSGGAIARGAQVTLNTASPGTVNPKTASANIVGWAFDKATAYGQLMRVFVKTPSFTTAS